MSHPPAGYYGDPTRPGTHRWWDGTAWAPLDAPGATFSTFTAVLEKPSVTIPAGYYEHPAHPGSVTWWNGSEWADVAIVPSAEDYEVVDVEFVRQDSATDVAAPPPGVYADPDDADHLRWWDGRAWDRATAAAGSAVITIDGTSGAEAPLQGVASLDDAQLVADAGPRRRRRAQERRRTWGIAGIVLATVALAGAIVAVLATR